MKPTDHQQEAIDKIVDWYTNGDGPFWLAGKAGTGKSSCLRFILDALGLSEQDYVICAPSNKAVGVLMSKGFDTAQTVARVAREARVSGPRAGEFRALSAALRKAKTDGDRKECKELLKQLSEIRLSGDVYWTNSAKIGARVKLIIVDEASMLSVRDARSLAETKSPVLLVGDRNQLLSVNTSGNKEDDSVVAGKAPQAELTEIIRQSGDGSIVSAAEKILEDARYLFHDFPENETVRDDLTGESITRITDPTEHEVDQYLAYSNNQCFRHIAQARSHKGSLPEPGDRLLAYSNMGDIVKSQIYGVVECTDEKNGLVHLVLTDEAGIIEGNIHTYCPKEVFKKSLSNKERLKILGNGGTASAPGIDEINMFYFADCITVHKSQGGQWNRVGVYLPQSTYYVRIPYDTLRRIKYTAVTRAKKELFVLT